MKTNKEKSTTQKTKKDVQREHHQINGGELMSSRWVSSCFSLIRQPLFFSSVIDERKIFIPGLKIITTFDWLKPWT
jgi:hypothetical protein